MLREEEQLYRGIGEDPFVLEHVLSLMSLVSTSRFSSAGLVDQPAEAGDFVTQRGGIDRDDFLFELLDDLLVSSSGRSSKSSGSCSICSCR